MNRRGSALFCCLQGCSGFHQQRESWTSKVVRSFAFFVITSLIAMSANHLCDKYSANHSFVEIKSDLSNLRNHLTTLSMEIRNTMEIRDEIKFKLKEVGNVIPKMSEAILKLRNEVSDEMSAHTKTILKTISIESVQQLIKRELEIFNADKTGRTDYALENSGGSILTVRDTKPYIGGENVLSLFGIPLCHQQNSPHAIIQTRVLPGECWAFKGDKGVAVIKLLDQVYITGVSMEHISNSISPTGETSSAPKDFSIWGLTDVNDKIGYFFGTFTYDNKGSAVQYFKMKEKSRRPYEIVELKIDSNHGNKEYTCVYRIRVHGTLQQ